MAMRAWVLIAQGIKERPLYEKRACEKMKTFLRRLAFVYSLWVYYVIGKNRDFDNIMVIQPQGFYSISFLPDSWALEVTTRG